MAEFMLRWNIDHKSIYGHSSNDQYEPVNPTELPVEIVNASACYIKANKVYNNLIKQKAKLANKMAISYAAYLSANNDQMQARAIWQKDIKAFNKCGKDAREAFRGAKEAFEVFHKLSIKHQQWLLLDKIDQIKSGRYV